MPAIVARTRSRVSSAEPVSTMSQDCTWGRTDARQRSITADSSRTIMLRQRVIGDDPRMALLDAHPGHGARVRGQQVDRAAVAGGEDHALGFAEPHLAR